MANANNSSNKADITGVAGKSPSPKGMSNASGNRIKSFSGGGANVAKGGLSARTSAAIVNGK